MRAGLPGIPAVLIAGCLLWTAAPAQAVEAPALAAIPTGAAHQGPAPTGQAATGPMPAMASVPHSRPAGDPVSLVVGLRSGGGTASIARLAPIARFVARRGIAASSARVVADGSALTVRVPAGQAAAATAALRGDPAVSYVEVDQLAAAAVTSTDPAPNDPAYARQWGLRVGGVSRAWGTTRGSRAVTIAVVDTGVNPVPDLAGRVLRGYDFVNKDSNPADDNGHGTMAAGVLGANADNGTGVAGICWYCRILPVKVLGAQGTGTYSDIADGIRYAARHGATVINLSLGGSADSQLLRDAVTFASAKGALVIAAAGNDGSVRREYPAAIPRVLAVGASTAGDARYPWSNYGSGWVDIAAPGCNLAQSVHRTVQMFCGTSSATPFVAGVAGLLAARTPAPTAAWIRTVLTSSAHRLPGDWVAGTSGRVDAAAAVQVH